MKKYYILRSDGSSIFDEGLPLDFICHCYYHLISRFDETFTVVSFESQSVVILPAFPICLERFG